MAGVPGLSRGAVALAALWTSWLHVGLWVGLRNGLIDRGMLELLQHETPRLLSWTGRVHPPLYSLVLAAARWGEGAWGVDAGHLLFLQGAVVHVLLVLLVGLVGGRWFGPWAGAGAAWLLAFGTESMRPFEHYPISALTTTTAALAMVWLAREGGRKHAAVAVGAVWLCVMLHLSPWFLLGPLAVGLWVGFPAQRRILVGAAAVALVGFLATTYPGLYRQLVDEGAGGGEDGVATVGWMNGWLLLPLLVAARRDRERPTLAALAAALAVYTLVTFGLQVAQIADGQPYPSSLHYFALVEPLVVLTGVGALARAARDPGLKTGVLLAAAALAVTQGMRWVESMDWMWRQQTGMWTQALQPWNWF